MKWQVLLIPALLYGCAVQVKTAQKPDQSFENYQTWCWMQGCDITYQGPDYYYDQETFEEVANAVAFNMYEKGYTQGDQNSDLLLNFHIILKEDSAEVNHIYDGEYKSIAEWLTEDYPKYQRFLRGSLTIDAIDREKSELVWRSIAVKYFEINPTYDHDKVWKGVAKAMKNFPARTTPK